jgi:hypothetical protein
MTATRSRRQRSSYALQLQQSATASNVVANVAAVVVCSRLLRSTTSPGHLPSRRQLRPRRRRSVRDIYNELGPIYFRQAYRMTYQSFKHLAALLRPYIFAACGKQGLPRYYRNGLISPDVRLACVKPTVALAYRCTGPLSGRVHRAYGTVDCHVIRYSQLLLTPVLIMSYGTHSCG